MKTEEELREKLNEIMNDKRLDCPTATVFENAPLALTQLGLEVRRDLLKWILDDSDELQET